MPLSPKLETELINALPGLLSKVNEVFPEQNYCVFCKMRASGGVAVPHKIDCLGARMYTALLPSADTF